MVRDFTKMVGSICQKQSIKARIKELQRRARSTPQYTAAHASMNGQARRGVARIHPSDNCLSSTATCLSHAQIICRLHHGRSLLRFSSRHAGPLSMSLASVSIAMTLPRTNQWDHQSGRIPWLSILVPSMEEFNQSPQRLGLNASYQKPVSQTSCLTFDNLLTRLGEASEKRACESPTALGRLPCLKSREAVHVTRSQWVASRGGGLPARLERERERTWERFGKRWKASEPGWAWEGNKALDT